MSKKFVWITLCLIFGLAVAGTRLLVRTAWAEGGRNSQAQPVEVKVDNFTFNPQAINIPANTTVTWVNKDDIPHVIAGNDGSFKSKALDTDDEYSNTFTKAGTYSYYCPIHPTMVGRIVVH
jgi:plastocyanin